MTMEEKIGQMIIVYHAPLSFLEKYNIGGSLIMRKMIRDEEGFATSLKEIQSSLPIPLIVAVDQEGGKVNRLSQKAAWKSAPSAEEMSGWTKDSVYHYHSQIAKKLQELGINLNLAPVLDPQLNSNGEPTYMKNERRAFAPDCDSTIVGFISAFTDLSIATTAKHFPGYDATVNSDHHIAMSDADSLQIANYLTLFKRFHQEYQAIMMSSILYSKVSDQPAVFSKKMVSLAREIDSNAVIMTDDLWGAALRSYTYEGENMATKSYPDSAFAKIVSLSFLAGNDMLMITYPRKVPIIIATIKKEAENNPELIEQIDRSVYRVLKLKQWMGLLPE